MRLYHGSTVDIQHIDLAKSRPNKDFGRAFYLSDDHQQALELAQFRAEFEEAVPVPISCYIIFRMDHHSSGVGVPYRLCQIISVEERVAQGYVRMRVGNDSSFGCLPAVPSTRNTLQPGHHGRTLRKT